MELKDIKIEKDIPIPEKYSNSKYMQIFDKMNIGDSIVVDNKMLPNIMATAYQGRKKLDEKYSSRRINDTQHRIWRIG